MKSLFFILFVFAGVLWADSPEDEFDAFQKKYPNSALRYKKIHGAVESLVKKEAEVYDKVLDAAKNHSSKEVRGWCCYTLGIMKREGNAKILAERLKVETNQTVKTHILDGLSMNKGRDPVVAEAVMNYLKNYGNDLPPQDVELGLIILVNYAAGPNKVPFSEDIITMMTENYKNLHLRQTLVRLFANEFLYPIIRDRLINQYVNLSIELKKDAEMADTITLLIQIARYRKKANQVSQDFGAWSYLIKLCDSDYLLQNYLLQISMFNYQNKPLRDLIDHLFALAADAKNNNKKERLDIIIRGFEEAFPEHKVTLTKEEDEKKGMEKTAIRLQRWEDFWKRTRPTLPAVPAYEPYSNLDVPQLQAAAKKKRQEEALLKAKKEFEKDKKPK